MKFLSGASLLLAIAAVEAQNANPNASPNSPQSPSSTPAPSTETANDHAADTNTDAEAWANYNVVESEDWNTDTVGYKGGCSDQANCLNFVVEEIQSRCGSASCEFQICYYTNVGHIAADKMMEHYLANGWNGNDAMEATLQECMLHPDFGVDYAGNMATDTNHEGTSNTGGCPNAAHSKGKGFWDEECVNPEVADEDTGIIAMDERFSRFCSVARPGETVHFMMHSVNGLDWNGENAEKVTCSGTTDLTDAEGEVDKWGQAHCAPSSQDGPNGQTYFPATDGSTGGTCSDAPEGEECVWSWTAPTLCRYEENTPICAISEDSVNTLTSTCPDGEPIVEYYEHSSNPNEAPPRVPLHGLVQHGDGTISFQVYNPYGNYTEPIDYSDDTTVEGNDWRYADDSPIDLYVVYDQANEIGNEVCDVEYALGKCATDNLYTAKCRTDGVAVVTVFASGEDMDSAAAKQITNDLGTEPFECCPASYRPDGIYTQQTTAAWTFLVHCDCPSEDTDARRLLKEDISSRFQKGELFESENLKKLHKIA
jgi:hypothetical protein